MRRTTRVALLALAFFALGAFAAQPARAADAALSEAQAKAEARRHFDAGEAHFQAGRFAEALAEYRAGYDVDPLPGFLINVAHCHRLMGELRKARAYYRKFLVVVPTSPRRKEIDEMIVELDKAIVEAEATPGTAHAADTRASTHAAVSPEYWIWSALAGQVIGPVVATMTLAERGLGANTIAAGR